VAATWAGQIGAKTGGAGNSDPMTVQWAETTGRTMVMIASQARPLLSGQFQDTVMWTPPAGWFLAASATRVDPYTAPWNGSFVSQAIFTKMGDVTNPTVTGDIFHTGLAGGLARVVVYGIDNSSPYVLTVTSQGFAANPTPAISVGFRKAMYVTAYADSSGVAPTWTPLAGFNQVGLATTAPSLAVAQAQLYNESGFIAVPRVTGGNINTDRDEFPYVIQHVVFGTVRRPRRGLGLVR